MSAMKRDARRMVATPRIRNRNLIQGGGMRRLVLNEQIVIFRKTHRNLANILYLGGVVATVSHRVIGKA